MLIGALPLNYQNGTFHQRAGCLRFCVFCSGYVLFLVIGAAIFTAIEAPRNEENIHRVKQLQAKFMQKNYCLSGE